MNVQQILTTAFDTGTYRFRDSRILGSINPTTMHIVTPEMIAAEEANAEADEYGLILHEEETEGETINVGYLKVDRPSKPRKQEASAVIETLIYAFSESTDKAATAISLAEEFRKSVDVTMAAAFAAIAPKIACNDEDGVMEEIGKIFAAM